MLMDKNRRLIILGVVFVTFNIVVFVIPFQRNAVFWSSYIFSLITIAAVAAADWLAFRNADTLKRTFMGVPILRIAINCLIAQLAVAAILMTATTFFYVRLWMAVLPSILILAFGTIGIVMADWGRQAIEQVEHKHIVKTDYMMNFRAELESLVPRVTEAALRAKLETLSKTAKRSDPVSSESLFELEARMEEQLAALKDAVHDGTTDAGAAEAAGAMIDELALLLNERNIKCRTLKRHQQ